MTALRVLLVAVVVIAVAIAILVLSAQVGLWSFRRQQRKKR